MGVPQGDGSEQKVQVGGCFQAKNGANEITEEETIEPDQRN
jgi:hypothetical protein